MAKDAKILCPMMGGECIEDGSIRDGELVACRFWVNVQGKHPQTGVEISSGDCAIAWTPMLMIENSKVNRETGASLDSFRNEMVKANHNSLETLLAVSKQTNILEIKE
jgi:hypothetical protein